jgi:hypothetical protein
MGVHLPRANGEPQTLFAAQADERSLSTRSLSAIVERSSVLRNQLVRQTVIDFAVVAA